MILNLPKDVHELDRFHQFMSKSLFEKYRFFLIIFFSYVRRRSLSPPRQYFSSISTTESLQKLRESALIQRFNDLYSRERLNAMSVLRSVSDDFDMNERICFNIMQVKKYSYFFSR
jgi:hypothetical protein